MPTNKPQSLIINTPYICPQQHWEQAREGTLKLVAERRPAGYEIFDVRNNKRRTERLDRVNAIRQRVDEWRAQDYPGITSITRALLEHWHDRSQGVRTYPFYFCQLEAIETLIWWTEAAAEFKQGILLALNIDVVVQHLLRFIQEQNTEKIEPVFDEESPIGSTRYMRTWYTTKPCQPAIKSQISHVVVDSSWEMHTANLLEKSKLVQAYAKNDHLGFQIHYLWNGVRRRFVPDFLIRLINGKTLILEIKGEDSEQNRAKRAALDAWAQGVNSKGGFGEWRWDVAYQPAQIQDILARH